MQTKDSSHAGTYDLTLRAESTDKVSAEINFKLELIEPKVDLVEDTEIEIVAISIEPEPAEPETDPLPLPERIPVQGQPILQPRITETSLYGRVTVRWNYPITEAQSDLEENS